MKTAQKPATRDLLIFTSNCIFKIAQLGGETADLATLLMAGLPIWHAGRFSEGPMGT